MSRRSLRPRVHHRPSRSSDSALGSSIGSRSGKMAGDILPTSLTTAPATKAAPTASAITRSASTVESLPRLSARASNRIHEHILKPLLAKSSLKDFHPIVKDCPRRIHGKEIVCLRDLEKTLIFMAPVSDVFCDDVDDDVAGAVAYWFSRLKERTKTAALYLDFCLTSIRCIQATVEFLSDREQTRPHDRPYTNGYFVDLVDQIKQYAQQVQAAKEKEEKGEKRGDADPEVYVAIPRWIAPARTDLVCARGEEVRLYGGLTKNGRPAELVRVKKNGTAISLATGQPVAMDEDAHDATLRIKRSLSEEAEEDEAILRSMARRKRSASATELAPKKCREKGCEKEFKRPCDLTKHEKTHSRPWKCPIATCKYHEYGWPTEKEAQRHHNDKHSTAPALYKCHYAPCPYQSKRESNCKQHMEKAHGWTYVRSKNNGKNRDKATPAVPALTGLPTPQTTHIRTPSSHGTSSVATPEDEYDPERSTAYEGIFESNPLNFPEYSSTMDIGDYTTHQLEIDYSPETDYLSEPSPYLSNILPGQDHFFEDNISNFGPTTGADFPLFETEDLYNANVQLPTPSPHLFQHAAFETSGQLFATDPMPHISPHGHGNAMLYTPVSHLDEGFEDFPTNHCGLDPDFQLFPSSTGGTIASTAPSVLFGELPAASINFPGVSGTQLLNFYAQSTAAAVAHHQNNTHMEWVNDDPFTEYRS
jgi:hypothetical protein